MWKTTWHINTCEQCPPFRIHSSIKERSNWLTQQSQTVHPEISWNQDEKNPRVCADLVRIFFFFARGDWLVTDAKVSLEQSSFWTQEEGRRDEAAALSSASPCEVHCFCFCQINGKIEWLTDRYDGGMQWLSYEEKSAAVERWRKKTVGRRIDRNPKSENNSGLLGVRLMH